MVVILIARIFNVKDVCRLCLCAVPTVISLSDTSGAVIVLRIWIQERVLQVKIILKATSQQCDGYHIAAS